MNIVIIWMTEPPSIALPMKRKKLWIPVMRTFIKILEEPQNRIDRHENMSNRG